MPRSVSASTAAIRAAVEEKFGPRPTNSYESLLHVLKWFADQPDSMQLVTASKGLYGKGEDGKQIVTGLNLGDLREIAKMLDGAEALPAPASANEITQQDDTPVGADDPDPADESDVDTAVKGPAPF